MQENRSHIPHDVQPQASFSLVLGSHFFTLQLRMAHTVRQRLRVFWERLVPPDQWGDEETLRQAGRVVAFNLAMLMWVVVFTPIYYALGATSCSIVLAIVGILLPAIVVVLRFGYSPTTCGNLMCCAGWCTYFSLVYLTGGIAAPSPVITWYASMPICAVYMCGLRSGLIWTAVTIMTIAGFAVANNLGIPCPNVLTPFAMQLLQFLSLIGLVMCVFVLVLVLTRFEHNARQILHEANCRLEAQSSLDGLTGIANRRSFDWSLEREWKRHMRAQIPLSLALIDVDWFKQYNDTYGHLAGDDVLRSIAFAIQSGVHRPGDVSARFGGEEFAVILPDTNEHQSRYVMAMIHQRVRALEIPYPNPAVGPFVTISIGIATVVPVWNESPLDLVHEADVALYRAKAEGRDRAIHAARLAVERTPAEAPHAHS
jgi:diguanylate cyclase (GGDEF)-like protein